MLSERLKQEVQGMYGQKRNTEIQTVLRDNPEELLTSFLMQIVDNLRDLPITLKTCVDFGGQEVLASAKKMQMPTEPKSIDQLIIDICIQVGNANIQEFVKEHPEEVLLSLLKEVNADLLEVSSMLRSTVQYGIHAAIRELHMV